MDQYNISVTTEAGARLFTADLAGAAKIKFHSIVTGDGSYEDFAAIAVYNGLRNTIHGNYFFDDYNAIQVNGESAGIISGNFFYNIESRFAIDGPSDTVSRFIITGNTARECQLCNYVNPNWDNLDDN